MAEILPYMMDSRKKNEFWLQLSIYIALTTSVSGCIVLSDLSGLEDGSCVRCWNKTSVRRKAAAWLGGVKNRLTLEYVNYYID